MPDARTMLLDAATELLSRRGYAATTTRAIAEAAGLNEVTLFRHFGTKRGLLDALGERLAERGTPYDVDVAVDAANLRATLRHIATREVERIDQFGAVAIWLGLEAQENTDVADALSSHDGPHANLARLTEAFRRWQSDGRIRRDVQPTLLAEAFGSLTTNLLLMRKIFAVEGHAGALGGSDPADDIETLVNLFCDAIEVRKS